MRQLGLDLPFADEFAFDNFLIGPNLELFLGLKALADGGTTGMWYLYGASGVGKTHLLTGSVLWAEHYGHSVRFWDAAVDPDLAGVAEHDDAALLVVDHLDALSPAGQLALFDGYNRQRERGLSCLCAGQNPPAAMPLRGDLQTRLAWGLCFQVLPPEDEDKAVLLRHRAAARGNQVGDDVCRFLVSHCPRNLGVLVTLLHRLDYAAVADRRQLTCAYARERLREWQVLA